MKSLSHGPPLNVPKRDKGKSWGPESISLCGTDVQEAARLAGKHEPHTLPPICFYHINQSNSALAIKLKVIIPHSREKKKEKKNFNKLKNINSTERKTGRNLKQSSSVHCLSQLHTQSPNSITHKGK